MSGPAKGPAEGVDGHSTKAADTPMHESCEACHSPGRTTPRGERRAPSWLTSAATEHGRGSQAPSATPSTASRSCERQSRKALEPGLVGGPTGRWRAARAPSRWVRISGMTCSVLPIEDVQPHSQLARRWLLRVGAADLTMTLCPVTCSLTEMVMGTSDRSVMAEPTHHGRWWPNHPFGILAYGPSQWPWSHQGACMCRSQRSPSPVVRVLTHRSWAGRPKNSASASVSAGS